MVNQLRVFAKAAAIAFVVGCCACSSSSDEEQIRAIINAVELAAESRDASDVMEAVAEEYRDNLGYDKSQLQGTLRGYFLIHPKIELLVRINEIKLETANRAVVKVELAMLGTKGLDGQSSLTADTQSLQVGLKRIEGKWQVARVDR